MGPEFFCVLMVLIVASVVDPVSADESEEIRIGLITTKTSGAVDLASILVAVDRAIEYGFLGNHTYSAHRRYSPLCDGTNGSSATMDLIINEQVDVVFGSLCPLNCMSVSYAVPYWNVPLLPSYCLDSTLDTKNSFKTLIRVIGSASSFADAFSYIFDLYKWHRVVLVSDVSSGICMYGINAIASKFQANSNITIAEWIQLTNEANDVELDNALDRITQRGRIVIFCHSTGWSALRVFLWKAQDLGMTDGDYLFLTFTHIPSASTYQPWLNSGVNMTSDQLNYRMKAFYALKQVTFQTYTGPATTAFFKAVYNKIAVTPKLNSTSVPPTVQNIFLHDATLLYLALVNKMGKDGLSYANGTLMTLQASTVRNLTGVSGEIKLDANGDRLQAFLVWTIGDGNSSYYPYMQINLFERRNKSFFLANTKWGIFNEPPIDAPICGFYEELCVSNSVIGKIEIAVGCVAVCVLFLLVFGLTAIARARRTAMKVQEMAWKINYDELDFGKASKNLTTSAWTMKSTPSFDSFQGAPANEKNPAGMLIAVYKGTTVSVHKSSKTEINLTKKDLVELFNMRELVHDNVKPFVGACVETGKVCYVMQMCSRGHLQDLLIDDDIQLDWTFKSSLITDLINGMNYLHKSPIQSHGKLSSTKCVVDNRWVLKITGYGLSAFEEEKSDRPEDEVFRDLLWTAPELLRMKKRPVYGTQKGDVYSFAIVLYEIIYRSFPYSSMCLCFKDIISKVALGGCPLFRPELQSINDPQFNSSFLNLVEGCWAESPQDRPIFDEIDKIIRKMNKGKKINLVDSMLQKLEKYANNLESLVQHRTGELIEEKQKTDMLLHRMLPPFIADELKAGRKVEPRMYSHVTIYFSDIVGFTTLSSESTPMQVVDFLNDLYSAFDDTISRHDVYKVETIGDAYMVVSGLPKITQRHVVEISNMALDLLNIVKTFKIRHRPDMMLMLRIGIHSGPCAAGVVGHTMPRYCLFGDTVNVASRMESTGEALKIHLSNDAHKALQCFPGYVTELRGEMNIKGKGIMTSHWLLRKEQTQIPNSLG